MIISVIFLIIGASVKKGSEFLWMQFINLVDIPKKIFLKVNFKVKNCNILLCLFIKNAGKGVH